MYPFVSQAGIEPPKSSWNTYSIVVSLAFFFLILMALGYFLLAHDARVQGN